MVAILASSILALYAVACTLLLYRMHAERVAAEKLPTQGDGPLRLCKRFWCTHPATTQGYCAEHLPPLDYWYDRAITHFEEVRKLRGELKAERAANAELALRLGWAQDAMKEKR